MIAASLDFGGKLSDFVEFVERIKDDPSGRQAARPRDEDDGQRTWWSIGNPEHRRCFATAVGTALFVSNDHGWLERTVDGALAPIDGALSTSAPLPARARGVGRRRRSRSRSSPTCPRSSRRSEDARARRSGWPTRSASAPSRRRATACRSPATACSTRSSSTRRRRITASSRSCRRSRSTTRASRGRRRPPSTTPRRPPISRASSATCATSWAASIRRWPPNSRTCSARPARSRHGPREGRALRAR